MTYIEPTDENTLKASNKLVLIGNGFDLTHGLKTSYNDFLDWYMCKAFQKFYNKIYIMIL